MILNHLFTKTGNTPHLEIAFEHVLHLSGYKGNGFEEATLKKLPSLQHSDDALTKDTSRHNLGLHEF